MSQFVSVSGGYSPVDSLMRQAARFPATVQKESTMHHVVIQRGLYTYEGDCEFDPETRTVSTTNFKVTLGGRPYEFIDQEDEDGCLDFLEHEFFRTRRRAR